MTRSSKSPVSFSKPRKELRHLVRIHYKDGSTYETYRDVWPLTASFAESLTKKGATWEKIGEEWHEVCYMRLNW
jgi:hypothetical protein